MDMNLVGGVMHQQAKASTLAVVNVSLLKTTNDQAEQKAATLLESITPITPSPEGNKGRNINFSV